MISITGTAQEVCFDNTNQFTLIADGQAVHLSGLTEEECDLLSPLWGFEVTITVARAQS